METLVTERKKMMMNAKGVSNYKRMRIACVHLNIRYKVALEEAISMWLKKNEKVNESI